MGGGRFAFIRKDFSPYGEPSRHAAIACWHGCGRGKLLSCEPQAKHRPVVGRARGHAAGLPWRRGSWLYACNWRHRSCRPKQCRGRCALLPKRRRRRRTSRRPASASAAPKRAGRVSPGSMSSVPFASPWPRRRVLPRLMSPLCRRSPGRSSGRPCRQNGWPPRTPGQQLSIPRRRRPWPCCRLLP